MAGIKGATTCSSHKYLAQDYLQFQELLLKQNKDVLGLGYARSYDDLRVLRKLGKQLRTIFIDTVTFVSVKIRKSCLRPVTKQNSRNSTQTMQLNATHKLYATVLMQFNKTFATCQTVLKSQDALISSVRSFLRNIAPLLVCNPIFSILTQPNIPASHCHNSCCKSR